MHIDMVSGVIGISVLLTWGVVVAYCYRAVLRRRAEDAEWEELARSYSDLDRELDQIWHGR